MMLAEGMFVLYVVLEISAALILVAFATYCVLWFVKLHRTHRHLIQPVAAPIEQDAIDFYLEQMRERNSKNVR